MTSTNTDSVIRAFHHADREALMAAPGPEALFLLTIARGDPDTIKLAAGVLDLSASPILKRWASGALEPNRTKLGISRGGEAFVVLSADDAILTPDERTAYVLFKHLSAHRYEEWDKLFFENRVGHPLTPRIAIEEARSIRTRHRESSLKVLSHLLQRFPNNFILGQMLADELAMGLHLGYFDVQVAKASFHSLFPLLKRDPDESRIRIAWYQILAYEYQHASGVRFHLKDKLDEAYGDYRYHRDRIHNQIERSVGRNLELCDPGGV